MIKLTAGAAVVARQARGADDRKFFTAAEYALVEELTEMIIPADEKSGGAKAARVAGFIDARLAEAFEQDQRDRWRKALQLIDAISGEMHGGPFLKGALEQRAAVLSRIAANEKDPKKPEEEFFVELKHATVRGYYTSKIGIHDDMDYKGNVYQTGEYAGEL
ncbi:MAG TPA: gluconate 2-dehydrogenase subunit 3 family protein [Xanthobacteraceae bacterium]